MLIDPNVLLVCQVSDFLLGRLAHYATLAFKMQCKLPKQLTQVFYRMEIVRTLGILPANLYFLFFVIVTWFIVRV